MGLLSNAVLEEDLLPGDHVYSWRTQYYLYGHHGIYVGDGTVIHFNREPVAGEVIGRLPASISSTSLSAGSRVVDCSTGKACKCPPGRKSQADRGSEDSRPGVVLSCLSCFLHGGQLFRFQYGVDPVTRAVKFSGTSTTAPEDSPGKVLHRAYYLLEHGFGEYDLFLNNCEDFALYCKTALVITSKEGGAGAKISAGRSSQIQGHAGSLLSAIVAAPTRLLGFGPVVVATAAFGVWAVGKVASDLGMRGDTRKVEVEDLVALVHTGLASRLATE